MSASIGKMLYGELEVLLVNVSCAFYPSLSVVSSCLRSLTLSVLNIVCYVITEVTRTSLVLNGC